MFLHTLTIENFMSYQGVHQFNLGQGLVVIEGVNTDTLKVSSNGAGKSSLLYAICWALYGKVPPGGVKNSIINHGSDVARVQLDLMGDVHLRILRQKPEDGSEQLEFWYGPEHIKMDRPDKTQTRLEAYFGIDWPTFCNTVYLGESSGTIRFIRATPAQRQSILENFVDDGIFQEAGERVALELKRLAEEEAQHRGSINTINVAISQSIAHLERLNASITMEELAQMERSKLLNQQVSKKEEELLRLSQFIRTVPSRTQQEVQAELNATQQAYTDTFAKVVTLKTLSNLSVMLVGQECPQCSQIVTQQAVHKQQHKRQDAWTELAKTEKAQYEYQKRLQELQKEMQAGIDHSRQVGEAKIRIEEIRQEIGAMRGQVESQALGLLHREREMAQQRISSFRQEQHEHQEKIGQIHIRMPHLKVLMQGMKHEIRNLLLDDLRNLLAYYTEEYRHILAGNEISIEFPHTTAGGKEQFEIVIRTGNVANPLTSGGETDRASFSIVLALRKALLYSKACPFRFLLVDDPIGKLDDAGAMDFFQLLDHLTADYQNILVTIPRSIQVGVPHRKVVVTRRGRLSNAEEVTA